jgi:Rrf2 family nitric oxide-sensitive transcriptional repressor
MQLLVSTDIALRTLIYLGGKLNLATIQEIADATGVSKTHLMKVVMTLVAANLLISERGRNGGIRLGLAPNEISVGLVVRLMETNLAMVVCMKAGAGVTCCPLLPKCKLVDVLHQAQNSFFNTLDQKTLADIL